MYSITSSLGLNVILVIDIDGIQRMENKKHSSDTCSLYNVFTTGYK